MTGSGLARDHMLAQNSSPQARQYEQSLDVM
jgi:hypothetical protein